MLGPKQQRWVDELRSGNWRQYDEGLLHYNGAYCCLGVASKLFNLGDIERCSRDKNDNPIENLILGYESIGLCSPSGLTNNGHYIPGTTKTSLVSLNDSGYTFSEIADIIEKYSELFFTHPV